jgi:hypothetical protein
MNRNRKGSRRRRQTIQPYTYRQARGVLPYLRSIVRSLRDSQLRLQTHQLTAGRLAERSGRPDRGTLIAQDNARRDATAAEAERDAALEELHTLDIYSLDPVRGEALVPFQHNEELAWYVFDLFDDEPFRFWRLHNDPLETRRPIAEVLEEPPLAG